MKKKNMSIVCLALSIVLMALPYGVAMEFSSSPTERVTSYHSYFSMMPFGYGNWCPIIAAIISVVIIVLFFVSGKKNVGISIEICLGIVITASLISWLVFRTFSTVGLGIFALHLVAFILQLSQRTGTR